MSMGRATNKKQRLSLHQTITLFHIYKIKSTKKNNPNNGQTIYTVSNINNKRNCETNWMQLIFLKFAVQMI